MYVRWKKRPMTRTGRYRGRYHMGAHALTVVLVESRRVNGSPQQRFVVHLGTIQVWENGRGQVAVGTGGQAYQGDISDFWARVSQKLDAIDEEFDRDAVEAMISANVPRPRAAAPLSRPAWPGGGA